LVRAASGVPSVRLSGRAAELASERGVAEILVSQSHSDATAVAFVSAQGNS